MAAILKVRAEDGTVHDIPSLRGATPNIQIGTVETLPAGSPATASMTGTAESPLLNLGIPKGADGSGGTDNGTWEYIGEFTETSQPTFESGKYRFFYAEAFFTADASDGAVYRFPCIDGYLYCRWAFGNVTSQKLRMFVAHGVCALVHSGTGTAYPGAIDRGNATLQPAETQTASVGTAFWTTTDSTNYPVATFGIKLWGAK